MRNCNVVCAAAVVALLGASATRSDAQTFENVGVRAQGLGGAFVAVADDATASWWNPAGLATGRYVSAVLERGRSTEPATPSAAGPAIRANTGDFAVAFPALGVSYYRLRISEIAGPGSTAAWVANRQVPRVSGTSVRSVNVHQLGTTVGQSIGDHLVVGTTVKLMFAGAVSTSTTADEPLDAADALEVSRHMKSDLDVGVMANLGHLRLGATVKNLTTPTFGSGADAITLDRQVRVGLAVLSVPTGGMQGWTVATDADLTTASTAMGNVRHVAAGLEGWLVKGRLGVRAGVSGNTVDDLRPSASGGVSYALTSAIHVNASRTQGRDASVKGWSSSVSVAF